VVTAAGAPAAEFVIHAVIRSETSRYARQTSRVPGCRRCISAGVQFAHGSAPPLGTGAGNLTLEDSAKSWRRFDAHQGSAQFPEQVSSVRDVLRINRCSGPHCIGPSRESPYLVIAVLAGGCCRSGGS